MNNRERTRDCDRPQTGVERDSDRRAQANLLAVAVALVLLTSVLGASIAIAESALVSATTQRDAADRHAAATLSERLISQSPPAYPAGVIPNREALAAAEVETLAPVVSDAAVTIELDGRTLFERGDASGGATVYRGVLVGVSETRQLRANLSETDTVTLPHRTRRITLGVRPGPNTTVHTVRVDGRIVLHNETGLSGSATVNTSARRTTDLAFETAVATNGTNVTTPAQPGRRLQPQPTVGGSVVVTYTFVDSEPATLAVTVDG